MAFIAGSVTQGVKDITRSTNVPSNCWAHLMYYLHCANSCIKSGGEDFIPLHLRDFGRYYNLSREEKRDILDTCTGPLFVSNLMDKIFFQARNLYGMTNRFFRITETTELLALGIRANSVVGIGGSRKEVSTVMLMEGNWADEHFYKALREAIRSFNREFGPSGYQSSSPQYYAPGTSDEKWCLTGLCQFILVMIVGLVYLSVKFKRFTFLLIGLAILGYVTYEIAPVYFDQKDALDAPAYSTWPLNNYTTSITLSGHEVSFLKFYFDSDGVNQTANALMVTTTDPSNVFIRYARGRYSWWNRQYLEPPYLHVTDLLSKDSFVYFRFSLADTSSSSSFNVTLAGVHSTSGSTDWTTIQWVQQLWFYGLFSVGTLIVIAAVGVIIFFCVKRP